MFRRIFCAFALLVSVCSTLLFSAVWEDPALWDTVTEYDGESKIQLTAEKDGETPVLRIDYELVKPGHGYVVLRYEVKERYNKKQPIIFKIKADAPSKLEIKMLDTDNSMFWKTLDAKGQFSEWTQMVVYPDSLDYGWGGNDKFGKIQYFGLAVSGEKSKGTVLLKEMGIGKPGMPASFSAGGIKLDPNWDKKGYGFDARRDEKLAPEDPGVLEWLKLVQDNASPEKWLVPSMDVYDTQAQTFNNMLVAMAFMIKGERERAERILDFYANAVKEDNDDQKLQNFFYKGEARGFYQEVLIRKGGVPAYHDGGKADRWMGDMCWMYFAYDYYEKEYKSNKYDHVMGLIEELLISWYMPAKTGGYIQHGWIDGDTKLHENFGHPEGNIDAYKVMLLSEEKNIARAIRKWLDSEIGNRPGMPLDLYTWKVMSFGKSVKSVLAYPDTDLRYLKTLDFNGKKVKGVWHSAAEDVNNIWVDGMGHMACAYYEAGEPQKAYFYANQMDNMLIDREINGVKCKSLPYALGKEGGFNWIEFDKGFVSCAAWYIFAKNQFNPMNGRKYNYK